MLRFPRTHLDRPLSPAERVQRDAEDLRFQRPECRDKISKIKRVAVVGGGLAGLMAALRLSIRPQTGPSFAPVQNRTCPAAAAHRRAYMVETRNEEAANGTSGRRRLAGS